MIDIEADGPIPGDFSMISLGAVLVEPTLGKTFYGKLKPVSSKHSPDALAISGFSREETLHFKHPEETMMEFYEWVEATKKGSAIFISDNK